MSEKREDAPGASIERRPWSRTPRLILCTGLFSSGSTWLFNVVAGLLREGTEHKKVAQFFADTPESFPKTALDCDYLVVKNHQPSKSLLMLATLTDAPILLTLREPTDAVASLMTRFAMHFAEAKNHAAASADVLSRIDQSRVNLTLRYEDEFFNKVETIEEISSCLGLEIPSATARKVFDLLTPQEIMRKIEAFWEDGTFVEGRPAGAQHDPLTHWHPRHVGDRQVGKSRDVLSPVERADVAVSTHTYCEKFGYFATWENLGCHGVDKEEFSKILNMIKNENYQESKFGCEYVFVPQVIAEESPDGWSVSVGFEGIPVLHLANGAPHAASGGQTGGYSLRLPDSFEKAASGHGIRIRVVARAAEKSAAARLAVAYSTNEVGNSGWHWFDITAQWSVIEMTYSVPPMKDGNGDFIGLLPGPPGTVGSEVCVVAARVIDRA